MVNFWVVLSSLGGFAGFVGLVVLVIRGIMRVVNATEDNTVATEKLAKSLDGTATMVNSLNTRVTVLEDRLIIRGNTKNTSA